MPKGEHFKKPNPRIIQVSFKVNQNEFEKLNNIVESKNMSPAEWFRSMIKSEKTIKEDIKISPNQTTLF